MLGLKSEILIHDQFTLMTHDNINGARSVHRLHRRQHLSSCGCCYCIGCVV